MVEFSAQKTCRKIRVKLCVYQVTNSFLWGRCCHLSGGSKLDISKSSNFIAAIAAYVHFLALGISAYFKYAHCPVLHLYVQKTILIAWFLTREKTLWKTIMRLEGTSIKRNILGAIFRNPFFFLSIFKKGCIQQSLKKMHARDIQDHPDVIDLRHTDTHTWHPLASSNLVPRRKECFHCIFLAEAWICCQPKAKST